jgi:S-DNA-T family DNA segregation ATPase FtsK/SpoIIIE
MDLGAAHRPGHWKLPPASILKLGNGKETDRRIVEEGGKILEATLREFGVGAKLIGMTVGPTVTRYELELEPGVKVNRVTGLSHDIAYAMASPDVRILAPIPGRSAIGVEVPNKQRQLVTLGDVLGTAEAKATTHPLEVGLGRDISGRSEMLNLATMPHLLIAGATGAGKSSCINSIITSILLRATPDQVRMILVDPKRVELGAYNDLPHLLTQVVTNPKKAANALEWAVREMDMRYELMAEVGVRDITGYNAAFDRDELPTRDDPDPVTGKGYERLPFILIVVDELNDLMMVAARDVEASICRIAQMARAVGIHLVIATQRPSVDVITGVIKANIPSRLAFSVSSLADSRVILDQAGAEKLIGQGDMLLLSASSSRAQRIQGSWVDEECVRKVAAHWRRQVTEPNYVEGVAGDDTPGGGSGGSDAGDDDELLAEAMELVVRSGLGSTSMLQRKLRVGFARAGRLMDLLERKGIVGPSEGSKARSVLMTVDEFEAMLTPTE